MNVVLVVDDDPDIRRLITRVLDRAGYTTTEASDGQEAIERLGREDFAAVVLDLMMPRVDGFGVVSHMIENRPDMVEKTVVVTAFPKAAAKERLHHLCSVLSKPFDIQELLAVVKSCATR